MSTAVATTRRSINPPSTDGAAAKSSRAKKVAKADKPPKTPTAAAGDAKPKASRYNRTMRRLLARHNAQLPDDVRTYLHGCVSHKMAVTLGRRSTPSEYFAQYAAALDHGSTPCGARGCGCLLYTSPSPRD